MADTLPVYPDLNALADISSIEDKCRKAGHLDPNESLSDRIKLDEENLKKYGLTRGDIFTNHWNMYMKVYDYKNKEIEYDKHANELFEKLPARFGIDWCPWDRVTKNINLNGQNPRVTYIAWGRRRAVSD